LPVSVIVPVHEGGKAFKLCLKALSRLDPKPFEVILVLDGVLFQDHMMAEKYPFTLIKISSRRGPAVARNIGATRARGDYLLFVDADVLLPKDVVSRAYEFLEVHKKFSAVIGCYDSFPAHRNATTLFKGRTQSYIHKRSCGEIKTFWTGFGMIRKKVFVTMGGFSNKYSNSSLEDVEAGYRITERGFRVYLNDKLEVKHLKKYTFFSLIRSDITRRALPWIQLLAQNPKRITNSLNISYCDRISALFALSLLFWPSIFSPFYSSVFALLVLLAILLLNQSYYQFVARGELNRRFPIFMALHLAYLLYSSLAFILLYPPLRLGNLIKKFHNIFQHLFDKSFVEEHSSVPRSQIRSESAGKYEPTNTG